MSKKFATENLDKLYEIITNAFLIVSILLIIVIIFVVINAETIALIIYMPLGISNEAFTQIGNYLRIYSFVFLGLFFYPIILRVYFSIQKVRFLVIASILGLMVYISFILLFISKFGGYVLPLGYGFFYLTMILFLFWIMKSKLFPNYPFYLNKTVFKTGIFFTLLTIVYYLITINTSSNMYINIILTIILIASFLFMLREYVSEIFTSITKRSE
jgi:peptidoglycan biosynthesis protein MviN/MurJ (putative lipid II flippase)